MYVRFWQTFCARFFELLENSCCEMCTSYYTLTISWFYQSNINATRCIYIMFSVFTQELWCSAFTCWCFHQNPYCCSACSDQTVCTRCCICASTDVCEIACSPSNRIVSLQWWFIILLCVEIWMCLLNMHSVGVCADALYHIQTLQAHTQQTLWSRVMTGAR